MPNAIVTILGREIEVACAETDAARVADLAQCLDARLRGVAAAGDAEAVRRLCLTALELVAENQAAGAALARAHTEIDRLHEIMSAAAPARPALRVVG